MYILGNSLIRYIVQVLLCLSYNITKDLHAVYVMYTGGVASLLTSRGIEHTLS